MEAGVFELVWEAPPRDLWIAAAATVSLAALAWWGGPRRWFIWGLRLTCLLVLWVCVGKPTLVLLETVFSKPSVAVWMDGSDWMRVAEEGTRGCGTGTTPSAHRCRSHPAPRPDPPLPVCRPG